MEVLKLENLSKYYTSSTAVVMGLTGISLSFQTGEFVAVTGESGSGKSTLAHVLAGILPYESGELSVYGRPTSHYDASDWAAYRRDEVSFISQNYGILAGNTVLENVVSALRLCGTDPDRATLMAEEMLEEVELGDCKHRRAGRLSSGQKQRLSIARALAKPSRILIADEPTGNLDRENSEKVIRLLKKASETRLVILITHEFEEAKDVATRRIVLSDGVVVTDAPLTPAKSGATDTEEVSDKKPKAKRQSAPYVTRLSIKARPVFSVLLCMFLTLTTLMTFVFLGNFIIALDDTDTRVYDNGVFINGVPERIVVMKDGREPFCAEDYEKLLSIKYTESLETWGYINDLYYYYRPDIDYHEYQENVFGPNYHPVANPDDYQVTNLVKFYEGDPQFLHSVPMTKGDILKSGRLPTSFYEVVSADPDYVTGDTVKVYIRNTTDWSVSAYFCASFEVVGETDVGMGLYFSEDICAMMTSSVKAVNPKVSSAFLYAPYDAISYPDIAFSPAPTDEEFYFPEGAYNTNIEVGSYLYVEKDGRLCDLLCVGLYQSAYKRMALVSYPTFLALTDKSPSNQVSLYIKDYAYADRVMDHLSDMGYVALSPFRLGATDIDPDLASERLVTLSVCLAALVLTVVLQLILLRAMFSALNEHFRLLANIGLMAATAKHALSLMFLLFTVIGEVLGAVVILSLQTLGISYVTEIFKYFDTTGILLLFSIHLFSVIPSLIFSVRSLKKAVFPESAKEQDIDLSVSEDPIYD